MLSRAISIVAQAFEGKKDKGGNPYILHCLRVMDKMPKNDEELRCIAVMHDLVEDTKWEFEDLIKSGFSDRVVTALRLLTHDPNEMNYEQYIHSISMNTNAILVKLADLEDNSDITRLKGLRDKDFERIKKYHKSYVYLKYYERKL